MEEGCLEPVHHEGRNDLRRVGPQAMQMVLIQTAGNLTPPDRRPTDLAALADQKITLPECKLGYLVGGEVHLIQDGQVQEAPENVYGSQKRAWRCTDPGGRGKGFALLQLEDITERDDAPVRRNLADLG